MPVCWDQVEVEQRMWCHVEELQALTTVVHSLENRLVAVNTDHEAEMQKHTQEVDTLSTLRVLQIVGRIIEIS